MDGKLRVAPNLTRFASQFSTNQASDQAKPGQKLGQSKPFAQDAVRLNVRGRDDEALAKVYSKLSAKPQPVRGRPADYKPAPVEPLPDVKPVPPDATGAPKGVTGLYRKEADGSTTVAFDGVTLSIKEDGTVEGSLVSPKGERLAIKGSFKDGKISADVEKLGSYTANLSFEENANVKGADGQVVLTDLKQVDAAPPPPPAKPKPPELPSVEGVIAGNTAYFGGFNVTFGKDGKVAVELNSPDGRKIQGTGSINEKGEITVRFSDPKTGFDGATYSGIFSRDSKDGGKARISEIKFLGNTSAKDADRAAADGTPVRAVEPVNAEAKSDAEVSV